jgi:SAM-dependent methyltransferase
MAQSPLKKILSAVFRQPIRGKNKLLARYYSLRYRHVLQQVRECQREIISANHHSHYSQYHKDEIFYWIHIPAWLQADHNESPIRHCLDIGCAYGTLALFCKKTLLCDTYCVDFINDFLSPSLIDKYALNFALRNIELDEIPWENKFDAIILTEVLEHFNFYAVPTLKKIKNILSKKGKLYLSTPDALEWGRITQYYSYFRDMPAPNHQSEIIDTHIYQFNQAELFSLFDEAGLKVEQIAHSPGTNFRHFNLKLTALG